MHRNFVVVGSPPALRQLAAALQPLVEVITLCLSETTALKPSGGVLDIQALNRSADEVLRLLQPFAERGEVIVLIGAASSIVDVQRQKIIDDDSDTMLWEEIEQDLRNEGRISTNSLMLMFLGGVIAAVPAAATVACASLAGEWPAASRALAMMALDAALIVAGAALVFWIEQRHVHRRRPLA
jgi:hypothetical protein